MARVTIKDIARELNLSPSTVSRALHNHPDISQKTKDRVEATARNLDYFPDTLAQGLRRSHSNTIGIIVPEIRHDFFSSVISGIEEIAYSKGFTIMVCQSNEDWQREAINLRALVSNRVAGVLVSLSQTSEKLDHLALLDTHKIPTVFFDRTHKDVKDSQVIVDDYEGAKRLVRYLLDKGYQRIAHIAGPTCIGAGLERLNGYRDAHREIGCKVDEKLIIHAGFREVDGKIGIKKLLDLQTRPDAIFAVNDPVAIGVYSELKAQKIGIPDDIALVGFCNNPISALIEPAITTVQQPARLIGNTAAELLIHRIQHPDAEYTPTTTTLKTELIIRNSA